MRMRGAGCGNKGWGVGKKPEGGGAESKKISPKYLFFDSLGFRNCCRLRICS